MIGKHRYSPGYCEPIVWGATHGYTPREIAAGLEIALGTVLAVIEQEVTPKRRVDVAKVTPAVPAPRIDESRRDPAYVAWAHTQRAAAHRRAQIERETQF